MSARSTSPPPPGCYQERYANLRLVLGGKRGRQLSPMGRLARCDILAASACIWTFKILPVPAKVFWAINKNRINSASVRRFSVSRQTFHENSLSNQQQNETYENTCLQICSHCANTGIPQNNASIPTAPHGRRNFKTAQTGQHFFQIPRLA